MDSKVWFITNAPRGFGRVRAEALERGDRVAATARKAADIADLKERFGDAVFPLAHAHFGSTALPTVRAPYSNAAQGETQR